MFLFKDMANKTQTIEQKIFEAYSKEVLENEKEPKSVFLFCKNTAIKESDFYNHFASLENVKDRIFCQFFDNTISLITKEKGFSTQLSQERLLLFYFTFFEVLLLNRSYVLFVLQGSGNDLQRLTTLKGLRFSFKEFATGLIQDGNATKLSRFTKHPEVLFSEGVWIQLLFLLKFWIEDTSHSFEKTDMAIEKSVRTAFELFDNKSLDSVIDLGKFLWKEKNKMA